MADSCDTLSPFVCTVCPDGTPSTFQTETHFQGDSSCNPLGNAAGDLTACCAANLVLINVNSGLIAAETAARIAADSTLQTAINTINGTLNLVPLSKGGTGVALTDPNADRILFWDDSAGFMAWLTVGSGLTLTGTTLTSAGGGTVTNTGGNLTTNSVVLGAGTVDTKIVAGLTTDGISKINLGVAGSTVGKIAFLNATSGSIILQAVAGALGAVTLSVPAVTDTLAVLAAAQTLTNKTIAGANNTLTVRLASDVTGNLPVGNLNSGTGANAATYWRGDGTWVTPAGAGTVTNTPGNLTVSHLMVGNGVADSKVLASLGTTTTLLHGNAAGLPTFGAVDLAADVTGNLPVANLNSGTAAGATTYWRGDGTWAVPVGSTAGTKTLFRAGAMDGQPPAANFATLDTRNSIVILNFDDTTAESVVFLGIVPEGADFTTGITVRIVWMAATATTGNVIWTSAFERCNTDLDSDSFATGVDSAASACNGTCGITTVTSIDHSGAQIDGMTAGDMFRIKLTRKAADGSDTMVGDAQFVAVELRQR